jgi:hypothetical protein
LPTTTQIDSTPLKIVDGGFGDACDFLGVDSDIFKGGQGHQRLHKSYGSVDGWVFTVEEDTATVPWTSSIAYALQSKLTRAIPVLLIADVLTNRYNMPASQFVYVMSIQVSYSENMAVRYTSLAVQAI